MYPSTTAPTYKAAAAVVARQKPPALSACEKQISKDGEVRRHASRFNTSSLFWWASFLLLEYTKQPNALVSSHIYSKLSRIFEAAVTLRDKSLLNFGHNASRQNSSFFLPSFFQIYRTNLRYGIYQRWARIRAGSDLIRTFYDFPNFCEILWHVIDLLNYCQEDDFASSITLLASALHRLKMIILCKSQVLFILLKACFLFLRAMSHCLFHHGTAILR